MMAPSVTDNPPSRNCNEDENDDISLPNAAGVIISYDSENESESDSEEPSNSGYELLPQEPENDSLPSLETREVEEQDEEVLDKEDEEETAPIQSNSTKMTGDEEQRFESACGATNSVADLLTMDQDHINRIKAAMAGFHLPLTSIPPWANFVPEENWTNHLLQRLNLCKGPQDSIATDKRRQQATPENDQQQLAQ